MICKNCGVDNKEHALFCSGCGQKLKIFVQIVTMRMRREVSFVLNVEQD